VARTHSYDLSLVWTGDRGSGTSGYRTYSRAHEVSAPGRPVLLGSSDPTFRGDADRWNPEQLLVAAIAQCHMLWHLHLCAEAGIVVTAYTDSPHGVMAETGDGGGHFTEVVLRPRVTVTAPDMVARATALHEGAHKLCFIANSLNFPVHHEPVTVLAEPGAAA
jgi:organic hydroperoxide reductase OsmC/OhrA